MTLNVYERIGSYFKRWLCTNLGVLLLLDYPLVRIAARGQVCASAEGGGVGVLSGAGVDGCFWGGLISV